MKTIDIDVEILHSGPELDLTEHGHGILTPQQVIAMASQITYKDKDAEEMALEVLSSDKDFNRTIKKSIMNSAGRGHASLTTSAYITVLIRNSSKIIDSALTGIVFGSSLMPSSRRIPVHLDNIVLPKSIVNADPELIALYINTSRENIILHERLLDKEISTQDAAKITQYGIAGGGFMVLPLESILSYRRELEIEKDFIPQEIHDFVEKIEEGLRELGMDWLYSARHHSPRNTYPYPHPFTDPEKSSLISDLQELHGIPKEPIVGVNLPYVDLSESFLHQIKEFLEFQEEVFQSEESIIENWKELELRRSELGKRYEGSLFATSFANISWRVWGEVKRHRTLEQQVESIYHAVDRATTTFRKHNNEICKGDLSDDMLEAISYVLKTPESIKRDKEFLIPWLQRFNDSLETYSILVKSGIPKSDAILIIPRGIKVNVYKRLNLFNIIDGYLPLRLCGTAEPEIQQISRLEEKAIGAIVPELEPLIGPKCLTSGYCPEPSKSYGGCKKIHTHVGLYNKRFHKKINDERVKLIESDFS